MESHNQWPTFQPQCSTSSSTQKTHGINSSYNAYNLQPPSSSSVACGSFQGNVPWPPPFAHLQQLPPPPLPPPRDAHQFWSLPPNDNNFSSGNHHLLMPQFYNEETTSRSSFENRHVPDNGTFYHNNYSLPTMENNEEEKTPRQKNQEFLNEFLKKLSKEHHPGENLIAQEKINISTVKVKLKKCLHLMNELKAIRSNLCNSVHLNESAWNTFADQANEIKKRLQTLLIGLSSANLQNLEAYVHTRNKKRERLKRQKIWQNEERREKEQQTKHLHEKIDAWQETISHSHLAAEMEKKLKKEADGILSVVRRKCAEANRMFETVKSVSKLRALKKQAAANKGLFTSSECDESFSSTILKLENLITARLAEYAEEERTLQVMLDEEHQVTRESVVKLRQQEQNDKLELAKQQKTFQLFGPEATINDMDPRYIYREYYTRPERNIDALIQVRQSWDIWLVPPATPESSSIPLTWVVPVKPYSNAWASYLGEQLP